MHPGVLTCGQVSKILHCCPRTAAKIMDGEELSSYRIGTGGTRRTTPAALRTFMQTNGYPDEWIKELPTEE